MTKDQADTFREELRALALWADAALDLMLTTPLRSRDIRRLAYLRNRASYALNSRPLPAWVDEAHNSEAKAQRYREALEPFAELLAAAEAAEGWAIDGGRCVFCGFKDDHEDVCPYRELSAAIAKARGQGAHQTP